MPIASDHIYENLHPLRKSTKIPDIIKALEIFSEDVKKILRADVEIETEHNVNFKSDELELRTSGKGENSAWHVTYRSKKLHDPIYEFDTTAEKSESQASVAENLFERTFYQSEHLLPSTTGYENIHPSDLKTSKNSAVDG